MDYTSTLYPAAQLLLALLLGALVGVERSHAGKTAGMRTFSLVSMGSCLFVVITNMVANYYVPIPVFDPTRLAAGVVTGVGFLGAGLIVFRENKLQGLTTAAGLWVACGIGIAVGFELIGIAVSATILTLFAFTALWFLEYKVLKMPRDMQEQ